MTTHIPPPTTAFAPAQRIDIDVGVVHVWSASLEVPRSELPGPSGLLSPDERARAHRLRIDRDREQFVVRRGLLRAILGRYLGCPPDELVFQYGACGKPALHPATSDGSLTFNLSYSYGLALYAVTRGQEVGVDVERIRGRLPHADLANRYFSASEREQLLRLPSRSTMQGFFNGWTRKESCVKALGTGLVTRLDSFAVTLTPGEPARLLTAPQTAGGPRRRKTDPPSDPPVGGRGGEWTLASLDTIPGYAAAVTVAGDCERILHRPWPPSTANIHGGNL